MVKFSNRQTAYATLVLPFGEAVPTLKEYRNRIIEARGDDGGDGKRSIWSYTPHLIHLAGEPDILLSFEFDTFRSIFEATRQLEGQFSCQWTLCRAFEVETCGNEPSHLCFLTHLRVRRSVYRAGGVEAESWLIGKIVAFLKEHEIPASLHAPVAWTDLLVAGKLPRGKLQLPPFLGNLHELAYEIEGKRVSPFLRTVTLLGYRWDLEEPPTDGDARPYLIRLRAAPGMLSKVGKAVSEIFGDVTGQPPQILITEGKTDLLIVPSRQTDQFLNPFASAQARERLAQLRDLGVEYSETNLLAGPLAQAGLAGLDLEPHAPCDCQRTAKREPIPEELRLLIPSGTRESIITIFELLHSALRDPAQCCELRIVADACFEALDQMFDDLLAIHNDPSLIEQPLAQEDWIHRCLDDLAEWCWMVESVLDERTTESFHEILTQTSRLGALRGNVQKYLLTADFLVKEYLDRVHEYLKPEKPTTPPVFHYGARDEIRSIRGGVVTIPSKYLFSLPLSIPQLWQETGVRMFHRLYPVPLCDKTPGRLREYIDRERRSWNERKEAPEVKGNTLITGEIDEAGPDEFELLGDLGDQFADFLVCTFGFAEFRHFTYYLVSLTLNNRDFVNGSQGMRASFWRKILQRLLLTRECDALLRKRCNHLTRDNRRDGFDHLVPMRRSPLCRIADVDAQARAKNKRSQYRNYFLRQIKKLVLGQILEQPAFEGNGALRPPEGAFREVFDWAMRDGYECCQWQYVWDFVEAIERAGKALPDFDLDDLERREKLARMQGGEVVDLSGSPYMNSYFLAGYLMEVMEIRLQEAPDTPPAERKRNRPGMAALDRSVYLSFFQREGRARVSCEAAGEGG